MNDQLASASYCAAACRCILKNKSKREVFFLAEHVCNRYTCPAGAAGGIKLG
jgi:hypothetical protein